MLLLFCSQQHISSIQDWIKNHHALQLTQHQTIRDWTVFYCASGDEIERNKLIEWRRELSQYSTDIIQINSFLQNDQPALFAFDMDSTVIQQEVIDELARVHGVYDEIARVTKEAMEGSLDFAQALRKRCALLKGLPISAFDTVYSSLTLNDGVKELLHDLKKKNVLTCIFSGGFTHILNRFQQEYEITETRANQLEIENGVLTGNVIGDIVGKEQKQNHLIAIRDKHGIQTTQTVAAGDGANDLLMLQEAGHGFGFHAKAGLKNKITNWLDFAPMYMVTALFDPS